MTKAQLTVLAGPTAVGKGTVVAALTKRFPTLNVSISATTRAPRPGELNGVHYYFVSTQEFDAMIERGDMLEFDHVVINDDVERAVDELARLIGLE